MVTRTYQCCHLANVIDLLKPSSITLSGSKLVRTCILRPASNQLRTGLRPASSRFEPSRDVEMARHVEMATLTC